jgi:predicted porin
MENSSFSAGDAMLAVLCGAGHNLRMILKLNFRYQITPALLVNTGVDYTKGNDVTVPGGVSGGAKYYQGSLGIDYFLSKRTDVYVIGVYQKASGTHSTGATAVAAINGLTPSTSDRQATVRLGIRHKFQSFNTSRRSVIDFAALMPSESRNR